MSALKYMSALTVCSVFAALISIVWQAFIALKQLNKVTTVLTVLLSIETISKKNNLESPKVAIAYGACSDLLVSGISYLNYTDNINAVHSTEEITNLEELLQNFAYFFQNGAAAERFVSNTTLFTELIKIAKQKHRKHIQWFLGGNAALMGLRFHIEGAKVLLGAHMSNKLRRLLPANIQIIGEPIDQDEIHLILEYNAGDKWGHLTAPRANRFILHSDRYSPQLQVADEFGGMLQSFQPRLFVVTGLHIMDKYKFPPGVREALLVKVQKQLAMQPASTLTHFEMASYVELEFLKIICSYILPYIDSIGLNEQELNNLVAILTTGKTTMATSWNPDIALTLDQTREVYRKILLNYYDNQSQHRMLTRIHVHTLAYQVVLTKLQDSEWRSGKGAAAKASLVAHRYVCQTDMVNPESASLLLPDEFYTSLGNKQNAIKFDPQNPVTCWQELLEIPRQKSIEIEICISPVLVCRVAKKAAGAGDNISAAALSQQV